VPETAAKSVTSLVFTCGSLITTGQIQVCIRLKAEAGYVPWGSVINLHWSISLAYISNILLTWELRNWGRTLPPFSTPATRLVATAFWLQVTDQRRHLWLSKVYVLTDSVIQINQHNYHQSWLFSLHRNLYVSTDSAVIIVVILIYSLILCWGNVSNSNVTMKFAQLHYHLW